MTATNMQAQQPTAGWASAPGRGRRCPLVVRPEPKQSPAGLARSVQVAGGVEAAASGGTGGRAEVEGRLRAASPSREPTLVEKKRLG